MVAISFRDDPEVEDVKGFVAQVQTTNVLPRGLAGRRPFRFDEDAEELVIDWDDLKRVIIEHQQYQAAQGFTSIELEILRVIEDGPDRMTLDEIRQGVDYPDSTIHKYTSSLEEKGLIRNESRNVYEYTGP